jgi:uncharacterized repeat protein (TIGR01451 family)
MRQFKACALLLALVISSVAGVSAESIPDQGLAQIQAYITDKDNWSSAEQKLESTLLYAVRVKLQGSLGAGLPATNSGIDSFIATSVAPDNTVAVTIRGDVSSDLLGALSAAGGIDIRSYPQFNSVTLRLPLASMLEIALRADVQFITPTAKPILNRNLDAEKASATSLKERLPPVANAVVNTGSVNWAGVFQHGADLAQNTGINGAGLKICTLSDSASPASITARQATNDLPASGVDIVENHAGSDEGTAMMEIIYDMVPGSTLGFATAFVSDVDMAANIVTLQAAPHNCNIIVDDVTYDREGAFQDTVIAQAINTVTAAGALYFSSAANSNNLAHNTSGTWEGDFVDGGTNALLPGGNVHSFGATPYDVLNVKGFEIVLQWSDPWHTSTNDYDLFMLNAAGTAVVSMGNTAQTGTQDPFEFIDCSVSGACPVGGRIVVLKKTGAAVRALRIDTMRGQLSIKTNGSTYGHNAANAAYTVAAVDLSVHPATQFVGTDVNNTYSSDGPRKVFYNPNGTAITPGNVLFGTNGGTTLNKVDITAGNCGNTTTPGLTTFCGTSASAPTAASIAGMLKQAKPSLTPAQIKTALFSTAIDIEAAGFDVTAGNGIVMADRALRSVLSTLVVGKTFAPTSINTGGASVLTITLNNPNAIALTGVVFTDTYPAGVVNTGSPNPTISGAGCTGTLAASGGGNTLGLTAGVVPAGVTCSYSVNVTSASANVYIDSSGAVTTPLALNSSAASATLTVTVGAGPSDMTITKTHAGSFTQGQTGATYTITVGNAGGTASSGTVTVTDTVPAGLTATAISGTGWTCTQPAGPCTRSDALAVAGSYPALTLTVNVAANAPATVINTATVSGGGETNLANDTANDSTTVVGTPDLTISSTHTGSFAPGTSGGAFLLTVTNVGGGPTVGTVTVVDTLSAGLTATAISGTGWTCVLATRTCTRSDALAAGASYPVITVTVSVASNAPSTVSNSATVSGGGETNVGNDTGNDIVVAAAVIVPTLSVVMLLVMSMLLGLLALYGARRRRD